MALTNTQTVAVQLEYVRPAVPTLFERADTTFSMIERRPVEMVSTRTARIPLAVSPGGNSGAANLDGGDLGRGSSDEYDFGQLTPIGMKHAVEITKLVEYASNSNEKAVANVTKRAAVNAMKNFRKDVDTWLQTGGNGVMATINSVAGGPANAVYTLANTPFGARLLRKNLTMSLYNAALTVKRGEVTINANPVRGLGQTQTVQVDSDPGAVATDVLLPSGLTGASPVWVYGIPYHHSTSTSGTWLNISRSNDFAVANGVSASASFSLPPFRLAINQIIQQLGEEGLSQNLVWHTHPAALAGYEEYGLSLSRIDRGAGNGDGAKMPAGLFDDKNMTIAGYPCKRSIHADPTRFDLLNLQSWGRVEWAPIDYLEIGGNTVFPVYGASGGIAAAYLFYFVCGMQFFVDNPKAISSVTSVTLPTGY